MFLFQNVTPQSFIMFFVVIGVLIGLNELCRKSFKASIFIFLIIPIIFTFLVWPKTAGPGTSTGTWFHWAKLYSVLAGCLGFMAIRFSDKVRSMKFALLFPPFILGFNILEAVLREFQLYGVQGIMDEMFIVSGPWNILNGLAGIMSIITLSGWVGIIISKDKQKDMIWPDQLWFWIIGYDLWNFAYVYNCVPEHSFYAGAALLISCTIPAFFIKKGAWLQHRAHTLGFWMIFAMTYPAFMDTSIFAVQSTHNSKVLMTIGIISFVFNLGVVIYQFATIKKLKRNPLKQEIFIERDDFKSLVSENS